MACPPEKVALCVSAREHGGCDPCYGFYDYAADCCATCRHYVEGYRHDHGEHPGSCTAIAADTDDVRDYMPVMWHRPPCLMFVPAVD